MINPVIVDQTLCVPGVHRRSGRTVAFTASGYEEAHRLIRLVNLLG